MMDIPTTRIVAPISDDNASGFIVINESDLTEGMELYVEPTPEPKSEPDAKDAKAKV